MFIAKSYKKGMAFYGSILMSVFLVTACGKDSKPSSENSPSITSINTTTHQIELGLIRDAGVYIWAQDKKTKLFETKTDERGVFSIDTTLIRQRLKDANITTPYAWIVATGGYDLDPNDDGILEANEAIPLKGKVLSIVKIDSLLSEKGYKFNLITTALAEMLVNSDDINDERIVQLAEQMVLPDVNKNGKYDPEDVLRYQMGSFSDGEYNLRKYYLTAIHDNDGDMRLISIEALKDRLNAIRVEKIQTQSGVDLVLHSLDSANTIYYGDGSTIGSMQMLPKVYTRGQKISLSLGQGVAFQECQKNDIVTCRKRQAFDYIKSESISSLLPSPKTSTNPYTDPVKVKEIIDRFNKTGQEYIGAQEALSEVSTEVSDLESLINEKQAQINAIDEQIRQLQPNTSTNTGGSSGSGSGGTGTTLVAPTGLTATPKTIGSTKGIQLSWNSVSSTAAYDVLRDGRFLLAQDASAGTSFFELSTTSGVRYCYTVQAVKGSNSPNSNQACATAP